eukprot:gene32409-biopygen26469
MRRLATKIEQRQKQLGGDGVDGVVAGGLDLDERLPFVPLLRREEEGLGAAGALRAVLQDCKAYLQDCDNITMPRHVSVEAAPPAPPSLVELLSSHRLGTKEARSVENSRIPYKRSIEGGRKQVVQPRD